ncbi:MAG: gfo/Idh/MocA family oxidoreductase [Caldilineae bacterium]|nr:MAG: gfo/Idh/MocA family oxidoreductase [Caldilineae bacterium]
MSEEQLSPVRVGQIGYGYWGPNLARNLAQMPETELAALADLDENARARAAQVHPTAAIHTNAEALLQDPSLEAIVIAAPARFHFPLALAALEADKHVFVEKPLAMNLEDAQRLARLAEERGRVLMVGHVFEYNPAVSYVKAALERGDLGELYYLYSRRVNLGRVQSDINALWSIAPHDVSIALFLLEQMPVAVSCQGAACLNGQVEDVVFLTLHFPGNVLCHIHASWLDPSKQRKMTVVGSKRMIVYDDVAAEGKIRVYDKGVYRRGDPIYGEYQYRVHSGDILMPRIDMVEPLRAELTDFARAIRTDQKPVADGWDGVRVVAVLTAAQASLQRGGVQVSLDDIWQVK